MLINRELRCRRIIALYLALLAFMLFCCGPFGLSAGAVVGVDDALIAILIAALAACGITFVTTGAFRGLQELVAADLQECAQAQGTTVGALTKGCNSGTNTLGQLLLNNRFVILIDTFVQFVRSKYAIAANGSVTIQQAGHQASGGVVVFDAGKCPFWIRKFISGGGATTLYTWENPSNVAQQYLYIVLLKSPDYPYGRSVYAISQYAWTTGITLNMITDGDVVNADEMTYYFTDTESGWGYTKIGSWGGQGYIGHFGGSDLPENSLSEANFKNALDDPDFKVISADGIRVQGGSAILPPLSDPRYNPGDGAILDVGASWGTPYVDVVDGDIPGEFSGGNVGDATISYDGADEVEDQIEDTGTTAISNQASDYQVSGLASVFPFCIPFDIYAFFGCLAAEPVAPVINWRFYVPGIVNETITLDLSEYDSVAEVLRTMELLAFIIGLAFVTREKFLRG